MNSSIEHHGVDGNSYFGQSRPEILELIKNSDKNILDIGCGSGVLGAQIKKTFEDVKITGIEFSKDAAAQAKNNLDVVIQGDIVNMELHFEEKTFDLIIFADVLEHLSAPESALNNVLPYLKNNGRVIVSLPNVRHFSVLLPLIFKDSWEYQDRGIMDKTHLRFFTRSSAVKLIEESGLEVKLITKNLRYVKKLAIIIDKITFGKLKGFFVQQWIIVAVKN